MAGVRTSARALISAAALAVAAGCASSAGGSAPVAGPAIQADDVVTTAVPTTRPPATAPAPTSTTTTAAPRRLVADQRWTPFARVGGVTLRHPSRRVERVGFHESAHEGARPLRPLGSAVYPVVLESRERGTGPRTAADVVVDPRFEIRSPVTGTVKRAGSYILYCDTSDDFVVIEPDGHPGWEVKVLHIVGERVSPGQRVVAGHTVLARRPHVLPFESQVDELTPARRAWPHVHIEVVDPSIPNIPTPGGGGCP